MKTYTNSKDENQSHYAYNDTLRNNLYDMIENDLTASVDGNTNENLTISGKEDLVEALLKIVKNSEIDSNIDTINNFQYEAVTEKLDPLMEAFNKIENPYNQDEPTKENDPLMNAFNLVNEKKEIK